MMRSLSKLVSSVALVGLLALPPLQAHATICGDPTAGTPQVVVCDSEDFASGQTVIDAPRGAAAYQVTENGLSVTIAEKIDGIDVGERTVTISGTAQTISFSRFRPGISIRAENVASGENGITVRSKGDIDASTAIGILSRNHNNIKVEVTAGVLQSNQSAIKVEGSNVAGAGDISHSGNFDVTLGGTAVIRAHPKQYRDAQESNPGEFANYVPRGIEVYRHVSKGGNVNVALKGTAKIEGGVMARGMDYGIYIHDENAHEAGTHAEIKVTTEKGTLIGSDSAKINKDGVYVWIDGNRFRSSSVGSKRTVIVVHNGKIYAKNSGFKIEHKHEPDDFDAYAGGTAYLTIGEKGEVHVSEDTGDNGGIYLNTPDKFEDGDFVGMRKQSVTVYGKVFGKAAGGTAIHLKGGGTVTIGRNAMLMPPGANDSYRTIKVTGADTPANDKPNLVVRLDRNFNGIKNIENTRDKTAFKYSGDGMVYKDLTPGQKITLTITLDSQVPCGFYNDCLATKTDEITPTLTGSATVFSLTFSRDASFKSKSGLAAPAAGKQRTPSKRGKVYEAVPSVVWDMAGAMDTYMPSMMSGGTVASASNPLQLAQNGTMAVADPGMLTDRRTWGSIEVGSGERQLRNSMTGSQSYDLSYSGFAAGVDLPSGDGMMFRVGLHHRQGKADLTNGGRVKVSGTGVGVGMTRQMSGDLMLDGWAGVTKFDDIEIKSSEMVGGKSLDVNEETEGTGYAIGMGISKRVDLDKLSLTQRSGLTWSSVSVDDYAAPYMVEVESESEQKQDKVSTGTSSGVTARYGALFEKTVGETSADCCKLFGSLDIEHNFSAERDVKVTNGNLSTTIESEAKPTKMRLGFGGSTSWNSGRSAFSGAVYHTTSGGGDKTTSGQIALSVRF